MSSNSPVLTVLIPLSRNTVLHRVGRGCPLWSESFCLFFLMFKLCLTSCCSHTAFTSRFTGLFSIFCFLGQLIGIQTSQKELRASSLFYCQNNIASRSIMTYIDINPFAKAYSCLIFQYWKGCGFWLKAVLSWSLLGPNRSLLGCSTEVGGREANILAFLSYLEM